MTTLGTLITFEGGEGAGKSTQARLLAERLRGLGHDVVVTREPGGSPVAEQIRALILETKPESPVAEALLFAAARAEHLAATIKPAMARGAVVICDRYIDSTRVYQGVLGRVDPALIAMIERATVAPYYPSLTLILDLPPEAGLSRAVDRGPLNRFDAQQLVWHQSLRAAFKAQASAEPDRCVLIDGNRDAQSVAKSIWDQVCRHLALGVS
jgi:dTMP kinase